MEPTAALIGLDAHPWAAVSHAYGPAEDLPDLLRSFAEGGEDAEEALSELYTSILHQGSVYPASAAAAPFLARIAATGGPQSVNALLLLGGLAESRDERGVEPGVVRAAVASQLPLLTALLADGLPDLRQACAWTIGHTLGIETAADTALPALRARWAVEPEPVVRAELLTALSRLDRAAVAAEARPLIADDDTPAPLRLAAVFAALEAGDPWQAVHHRAVLALLPAREAAASACGDEHAVPLDAVVGHLLERETEADRDAALTLLETALRDERPEVQAEARWAAAHACDVSRSASARIVPAVLPHAASADVLHLLGKLGPLAAEAAPALVPVLAELAATQPDDEAADQALAALVLIAPAQAAPLLARDLDRRPRARTCVSGTFAPEDAPFPFDADLLAAARTRLASGELERNHAAELVTMLRQWGTPAAEALPELLAVLPRFRYAATAIAAVAGGLNPHQREQAVAELRAHADQFTVAKALYDLNGETEALLAAAETAIAGDSYEARNAIRAVSELGPAAAHFAPALRAAVFTGEEHDTTQSVDTDASVALALWHLTGDAEEAVPLLASALDRAEAGEWFRWTAARIARDLVALGPAARPLTARLESLLDDPRQAPSAVLALLAVADPATLDRSRLAEAALRPIESGGWSDVAGACRALRELGPTALTPDQLARLRALATTDLRLTVYGSEHEMIRKDERLRAALTEMLS